MCSDILNMDKRIGTSKYYTSLNDIAFKYIGISIRVGLPFAAVTAVHSSWKAFHKISVGICASLSVEHFCDQALMMDKNVMLK